MPSFEELGVSPPLEEALAAEGIEVPTPLQAQAVPLLLRGNSAVLRAGPGSGILVAYGVPLLERLTPAGSYPQALVITLGRERAGSLATSLARLAVTSGHRVGALGVPWAVPERSDVLFATQEDLERYVRTAAVKVDEVRAVVLDQAGALLADGSGAHLPILLASIERQDLQLIVVSDPIDSSVRELVERHARRAVFLPPEAGSDTVQAPSVPRGSVRVHAWTGDEDDLLAAVVEALLDEGFAHVMTYARSEDRAADVGDLLVLRGFAGGAPGDRETPVWLGVDALEARAALEASGVDGDRVVSLSLEVPIDADELDRRHGRSPGGGVVLAHPRELPHLRRAAREAGYSLEAWTPGAIPGRDPASTFLEDLTRVIDEEDLLPHLVLLEPMFRARDPAEVAAALALLLRRAVPPAGRAAAGAGLDVGRGTAAAGARPPAWVRLFLSVGDRDGVGPGDLLGAILGEAGVEREQVGRIDLRDTFSKVEVHEEVADRVIRALNGTTIRGRSVRADFDRKDARADAARRHAPAGDAGERRSGRPRPPGGRPGAGKGPGGGGGRKA